MALIPKPPTIPKAFREQLTDLMYETLVEMHALESCLGCTQFDEQHELCTKFQVRPPARIIAFGCPEWTEDKDK